MTMISLRIDAVEAAGVDAWAERLGITRSELARRALRAHLAGLAAERDAHAWERTPRTADEAALDAIAEWGPAEDWSDWADATG